MIGKIYSEYVTRVYRFVYGRIGDTTITEDIVADTFTAFIEGIERFKFNSKVSTYIFGIALNKTRQHWETTTKENRAEYLEEIHEEAIEDEQAAEEQEAVELLVAKEIQNILSELPENYKQVLTLRFLQNYNTNKTAEIMGITVGNARVLQNRALKKAKQLADTKLKDE